MLTSNALVVVVVFLGEFDSAVLETGSSGGLAASPIWSNWRERADWLFFLFYKLITPM